MSAPVIFNLGLLARAPIVREARLIRDLTMPTRDWSAFDAPTWARLGNPDPMRQPA